MRSYTCVKDSFHDTWLASCVKLGILSVMSTDVVGTATGEAHETPAPWIPTDTTLGARLALVRWRMGWNIKEAAAACAVPAASWRLWEIDGSQPRNLVVIAKKIADRAGCDLGWLVGMPGVRRDRAYYPQRAERPADNRPSGRPKSAHAKDSLRRPRSTGNLKAVLAQAVAA